MADRSEAPITQVAVGDFDVAAAAAHGAPLPLPAEATTTGFTSDAAESIAISPTSLSHRSQSRPKPTKDHPAGWPWLTPEELEAALKLKSAELVEEVHALALRLLASEEQRENRVDGKAQGLLVTAGLSLTAASTFGGVLLQHPEYLDALGVTGAQLVIWGYGLGLVAGLFASLLALLALFVKNAFRAIDEREALASDALAIVENEGGAAARTAYRRYMTLHYWRVWQRNFTVLESKAKLIRIGQVCFTIFLVSLMVLGSVMAYTSLDRFLSH